MYFDDEAICTNNDTKINFRGPRTRKQGSFHTLASNGGNSLISFPELVSREAAMERHAMMIHSLELIPRSIIATSRGQQYEIFI